METFDPNRPDFAPYGFTCVRWHPEPMRRPDHHNEIELNFLESGSVTYLFGGRKTVVEAGRLHAFWAAIPHQIIDFGRAPAYFVATIPLQHFLQWRLPGHFTQPIMQGQLIHDQSPARTEPDARMFARWQCDLAAAKRRPEWERPALLEIHARLLRMALVAPARPAARDKRDRLRTLTDSGLNKVERMACFVAQHYTEPLTVEQIAGFAALHPNYAMNLFQKSFGTTLGSYLTQHRVSHAQRLLVTTEDSIADIAFGSGFNSISRFNEAFRRACGCAPREYRRAHAHPGAAGPEPARAARS